MSAPSANWPSPCLTDGAIRVINATLADVLINGEFKSWTVRKAWPGSVNKINDRWRQHQHCCHEDTQLNECWNNLTSVGEGGRNDHHMLCFAAPCHVLAVAAEVMSFVEIPFSITSNYIFRTPFLTYYLERDPCYGEDFANANSVTTASYSCWGL